MSPNKSIHQNNKHEEGVETELKKVGGWTPIVDQLVDRYGITTALVFGVVWRHCRMRNGFCHATQDHMSNMIGIKRQTLNKHLGILVKEGFLEDLTPGLRNRPHQYRDTGKCNLLVSIQAEINDSERKDESSVNQDDSSVNQDDMNTLTSTYKEGKKENAKRLSPLVSKPFSKNEKALEINAQGSDETSNLKNHPTILALKEITGYFPKKEIRNRIIEKAPVLYTDRARSCFEQWCALGYNPENYDGWFFDWYATNRYYMHPKDKDWGDKTYAGI